VTSSTHRLRLVTQRPVFCDPTVLVASRLQALDTLTDSLGRALPAQIERQSLRTATAASALGRLGPHVLDVHELQLTRLAERSAASGRELLSSAERGMATMAARLEDLSPLAILARGYAVCYEQDGTIVRSAGSVKPGERVRVRLSEGRLGCIVETSETED
jgi:exodeoxyribonuclease VII large subunit